MTQQELIERIKEKASSIIMEVSEGIDCPVVRVEKGMLLDFMKLLKNDLDFSFDLIADVTAVDYPERVPRFDVIYHIFSIKNSQRVRVKVSVDDGGGVESVTCIWRGAEWLEREVYDMFGITFYNHPDLRRILMEEDFKYYPLRKDFPLEGIEE
ncbi:MAG: NADH-quinone oxidoreductase subunit C [Syntrophobacterales bacterium]|nr:NADH-quinone oxidoreductase subunit C [Syntrophobacterales bacterium]